MNSSEKQCDRRNYIKNIIVSYIAQWMPVLENKYIDIFRLQEPLFPAVSQEWLTNGQKEQFYGF